MKVKFQSSHRGIEACVCQYFLFSFKQARICNDLVILFLRPAVSRPHTEKPLSTYAWLAGAARMYWAMKDSLSQMFTRLFQKSIVSDSSEVARWCSSTSNMYLDNWLPSELGVSSSGVARQPGLGAKPEGLGDGSPQRGPGTEPRWSLGAKPPEAEENQQSSSPYCC